MKNKWRIIFLWVCLLSSIPLSAEITEYQVNEITYVYDTEKKIVYNKQNTFSKDGDASDYCLHVYADGHEVLLKKFRKIFTKERAWQIGQTIMRAHIYTTSPGDKGEVDFLIEPEIIKKITFQELYALEKALKQFKDYITFSSKCKKDRLYIIAISIPFYKLYKNNTVPYQPLR